MWLGEWVGGQPDHDQQCGCPHDDRLVRQVAGLLEIEQRHVQGRQQARVR